MDAPEPRHQMGAGGDHAVEMEILEADVSAGTGVALKEAVGFIIPSLNLAQKGQSCPVEGILDPCRPVEEEGGARIAAEIERMLRQIREEEKRCPIFRCRHQDQRRVRRAVFEGGREARAQALAQEDPGKSDRVIVHRHILTYIRGKHAIILPCSLARMIAGFAGRGRLVPNTIALVDDDRNILTSVSIALEAEGFHVRCYGDGAEALRGLVKEPADLAILDIKMPRMDGMELLGHLRKESAMPIIFLTSKDDEVDEVLGLRMGADDYIRKPFSQRLLVERIRALLRRGELMRGAAEGEGEPAIIRGDLVLDPGRHQCSWRGTKVELTVTEFLILKSLALRPGHVKSRDQLMDGAYGEHIYVDDRTIDSHIKRLRKKFKAVDTEFAEIETLYGVGYRYRDH